MLRLYMVFRSHYRTMGRYIDSLWTSLHIFVNTIATTSFKILTGDTYTGTLCSVPGLVWGHQRRPAQENRPQLVQRTCVPQKRLQWGDMYACAHSKERCWCSTRICDCSSLQHHLRQERAANILCTCMYSDTTRI